MEARWGSVFAKYSTQKFNPRRLDVSENDEENFYKPYRTPSVALLESRLHKVDPRRANDCLMNFRDIFSALIQYSMHALERDRNIFAYHYGFLCFRHLLHLICYSILQRTQVPPTYFENLHPDAEWSDLSNLMTIEASNEAQRATEDAALFGEFCDIFTSHEFLGSPSTADLTPGELAGYIGAILWKDCDSLLTLCVRGLLPGFSLLLLVLLKLLQIYPNKESFHQITYYVQTLVLRLYPVGSHCDRHILQGVHLFCRDMLVPEMATDHLFVSPEDTRTLYQAYSGLLLVWRQNGFSTKSVPISLMSGLTGVVASSTANSSATTLELIDLTATCFDSLWLLIEDRSWIAGAEHSDFVSYLSNLLHMIRTTNRRISSKAERLKMAQMLADTEIISLVGRLILPVLDEASEYQLQNTAELGTLLEKLTSIEDSIEQSTIGCPELFTESRIEWAKTFAQLESLDAQIIEPELDMDKKQYIRLALRTWLRYSSVLRDNVHKPQKCAYPRCAQPEARGRTLRFHYTREQRASREYCDMSCQQRHWALQTSGSHL